MGDACSSCEGVGKVRVRGRPVGERVPCGSCGGSGMQKPRDR